jgi:hypothetical protein
MMEASGLTAVQTEDQEIIKHVKSIDIDRLERVLLEFAKICDIPEEVTRSIHDDLIAVRRDQVAEKQLRDCLQRTLIPRTCTAHADGSRGIVLKNASGFSVTIREVVLLSKTQDGNDLTIAFSPDVEKSPIGTEITEREWVVLAPETEAVWLAPRHPDVKRIGKFTIIGGRVTAEYQSPVGAAKLLHIEANGADSALLAGFFQPYFDQLLAM